MPEGPDKSVEIPARLRDAWTTYTVNGAQNALFHQDQPIDRIYVLLSGIVKLSLSGDGREETILKLLAPPSVAGTSILGGGRRQLYSAVTVTPMVEVASLDVPEFEKLGTQFPEVLFWTIRERDQRLIASYRMLAGRRMRIRQRLPLMLEHVLDVVARGAGAEGDAMRSGFVASPLSNVELAQLVQTAPETLSRELRALETRGVVRHAGHTLEIDPVRLRRMVPGANR